MSWVPERSWSRDVPHQPVDIVVLLRRIQRTATGSERVDREQFGALADLVEAARALVTKREHESKESLAAFEGVFARFAALEAAVDKLRLLEPQGRPADGTSGSTGTGGVW